MDEPIRIIFEIANSDDYESCVMSALVLLMRDLKMHLRDNYTDKCERIMLLSKIRKTLDILEEGE